MSDVDEAVERSFRELVQERRYRSIRVTDICERACVSRKAFYANFDNKDDLVRRIFDRDVVRPIADIYALLRADEAWNFAPTVLERIYRPVGQDGAYYRSLVVPMRGNDDTFIRVATAAFYDLCRQLLESFSFEGTESEADVVAYTLAAGQAMSLEKWICDGYAPEPGVMASIDSAMLMPFWSHLGESRRETARRL